MTVNKGAFLVLSDHPGYYAVGRDGPDLEPGQLIEIAVGGRWIKGHVAQSEDTNGCLATPGGWSRGLYVVTSLHEVIGLCTGMKVHLVKIGEKKGKAKETQ